MQWTVDQIKAGSKYHQACWSHWLVIIKPLPVRAPMESIVLTCGWRDGSVEKSPWSLSLGTTVPRTCGTCESLRTCGHMWQSSRILGLRMERQEMPRASWPDRLSELSSPGFSWRPWFTNKVKNHWGRHLMSVSSLYKHACILTYTWAYTHAYICDTEGSNLPYQCL